MNILSTLPSLDEPAVTLTDEELAAQEKSERIAHHREKVRNGPVKFTFMTAGQVRRAEARARKTAQGKVWRKQVRDHFANKRTASFVRAHLQKVGLVPFLDGREISLHDQIVSTAWIAQRFGVEVKGLDGEGTGRVSFRHDDIVTALEGACEFLRHVTGETVSVPEGYEPAIYAEDAA